MNILRVLVGLVAFLVTAPVYGELEAVKSAQLRKTAYRNKDLRLELLVVERPVEKRKGHQWGESWSEPSEMNGERRANWIRESDERTIYCSIPLDEKVVWRLIREDIEPPEFRFMAITNLHLLEIEDKMKAKMLLEAVQIEDAWVRGYAWWRLFWFPERELVAQQFAQVVKDPCQSNAHSYLRDVCDYYALRNEDGTKIEVNGIWRGLVSESYRVFHKEIETVAESLHKHDSKLMSLEDLAEIRKRRAPPDGWFRRFGGKRPKDLSYFLNPYQKAGGSEEK